MAHFLTHDNCPLVDLLESTLVKDIAKKQSDSIVSIEEDGNVTDVLKLLSENRVLSIPVLSKDSREFMGFIDVLDILALVIKTLTKGETMEQAQWSSYSTYLDTLIFEDNTFSTTSVRDIIDLSKADPFMRVYGHGTLVQLIEEAFSKGIHRVALINHVENSIVENIVSQSDVLQFIAAHIFDPKKAGILAKKSIRDLNLGTREIITMSKNALTIHAFYLMFYNKVSAVAIVDEAEELVANLSASETRGLTQATLKDVLLPVSTFLSHTRATGRWGGGGGSFPPPVTCTLDTTIETVVLKLSMFHMHRIWLVDESNKPIGIISLTDIINMFKGSI